MKLKTLALLLAGAAAGGSGQYLIEDALAEPAPLSGVAFYPRPEDVVAIYEIAGRYTDCDFVGLELGLEATSIDGAEAKPVPVGRGVCR